MGKTLVIAEAGVNHNGSLSTAYKLIDSAKVSGADVIKFQSFRADSLVSKKAEKAQYQKSLTDANETQYAMIKRLELDEEAHSKLIAHCMNVNIEFLSAPFDLRSINLLISLGLKKIKVPSGEITNYPYLKKLAKYNKQVIMSTGMSNMDEISEAIEVLTNYGTDKENIILLHCNTEYPTPFEDVNLHAMKTMQAQFGLPVGYSDHTVGLEVAIGAVALGAQVIEKHFTLDRNMPGPDHKASLEPDEFRRMVQGIRNIELAIGDGIKKASPSEQKNMVVARKSIVASRKIKKGEILSESNITTKRPGSGISPMMWNHVLGQSAGQDYEIDDIINID